MFEILVQNVQKVSNNSIFLTFKISSISSVGFLASGSSSVATTFSVEPWSLNYNGQFLNVLCFTLVGSEGLSEVIAFM